SIGIAVYDGYQDTAQDLLRESEVAMYRAKRAGTDRIELFKAAMRGEKDERVALESDLRRALERDEIRIYYQPIVRLSTSELAGFEALIRWDHPQMGQLDPSEFVPIAEDSDLINSLGKHVLQQAVRDASIWQKRLPRTVDPLFVSVNISSRELLRQNLAQEVRSILRQELIEDGCLRLEVTESLVMENPERAAEILTWLKEAGAGLSMDDFGTGYSSLSYLQRFPFDTIKIDRTLVQDESPDERGAVIVRSVVALAHELGRSVVAEGVETPEIAGYLRELGCELAQGFFFGQPMTQREVIDLLKIVRKSERNPQRRDFRFWRRGKRDDEAADRDDGTGTDGAGSTGTLPPVGSPASPDTPSPYPLPAVLRPPNGSHASQARPAHLAQPRHPVHPGQSVGHDASRPAQPVHGPNGSNGGMAPGHPTGNAPASHDAQGMPTRSQAEETRRRLKALVASPDSTLE
ncbi:MAG: EAL domain-containing protein, partial [Hyphomicrobiaceae bacterium]